MSFPRQYVLTIPFPFPATRLVKFCDQSKPERMRSHFGGNYVRDVPPLCIRGFRYASAAWNGENGVSTVRMIDVRYA